MSFLNQIKYKLTSGIKYLVPNNMREKMHPRQLHAFSIGTPKSGTTSIAGLFEKNYRASHEPERIELIHIIHKHFNGKLTDEQYIAWLLKRDKRIWLDIESNCFLGYRPDLLYRAYPKAKYILSVRAPLSWLDSMMNHTINYPPPSERVIKYWHGIFFKPDVYPHKKEDKALIEYNVYSVEAYLRFWSDAVAKVLDVVPKEQLLIVPTNEMKAKANDIAKFLNIDVSTLDFGSGHLNKAPAKFQLLEKIEAGYVDELIAQHCESVLLRLREEYQVAL